ncbi:Zinc finger CW-type PWWP domain 1 [Schistosoma japonicum]|uniref:Zinc finger CW-type PWWP domain 1 n=1 Tax=Schistosoma japonicum TaxID=6182 RepID=A0A4Z2D1R0_SCHJA|nr:Zinc finger CW-type PWWP domain 1 [Schistosoma japonicum]
MHNPCKEPEDLSAGKDQFIFGHFSVGSVVWARIQGYPDWPTMVFYNSQGKYAEFNPISKEVTYYYVVTLDPKRSKMSRVEVDNIHKFTSFDEINLSKVPKRFWRRLLAAGYEAENALLLSTKDRIATYGYNHKYEDISFKVAAQIKSSISSNQRILKNVSYNLKRKRAYKRRVPLIHSSSINVDPKGQTDNLNTDFDHTSGIVECNAEKCSSSFLKAITNSTKLMSINNHEHHEYGEDSNRYSSSKSLKNHNEIDITVENNLSVRLENDIFDLHINDSNLGVDNNENADNNNNNTNNTDDNDLAIIENENDLNYYSPSFLKPIKCNQMTQELICSISMHVNPNDETTDTELLNDNLCKEKANLTRNVNDNDKHENLMTNNENYFKLACFDLSFYSNMHNLNVNDIQMSTNHSYRHTYQHWSLNCNKRILYENVPFHYQYFGDNEV